MAFRHLEDQFIYYPEQPYFAHPKDYGWPYQDIWITTEDDVRIHGWWIGAPEHETQVLFLHGNAGNISHRLDRLASLGKIPARFLLLDYRGYGQSEGKPSEKGLYKDAHAAYQYLLDQGTSPDKLVVFGESLGGAVAIDLASTKKVGRLIAESTFTSLRDMANIVMPWVPSAFVSNGFQSIEKLSKVHVPLLIIHGTNDSIVPFEMGKKLYENAKTPKKFFEVPGADHNDVYVVGGDPYRQKITRFILGRQD